MKRHALAWGMLLGCTALLVLGLARLFQLRQMGGDVYPAYSSLRPDPLGVKALYLALQEVGLEVRRNFRPWPWVKPEDKVTWFMVGIKRDSFQDEWPDFGNTVEALAKHGGRLLLAFEGELTPPTSNLPRLWRKLSRQTPPGAEPRKPLEENWQFEFAHVPLPQKDQETFAPTVARRASAPAELPETLMWRSSLVFTNASSVWRVLYRVNDQPVMMERPWGRGTLVLLSDSFLLSNEAMRFQRQPALLAWLLGRPAVVVFNETHLGVIEQPGMGSLLRQYRLQGVAALLGLLALLYIWQNTFPLAPAPQNRAGEQTTLVRGRDTMMGLVNLLRRGLPPRQLLRVCLEHWKDTAGRTAHPATVAEMEARINAFEQTPARLANPASVFAELARLSAQKRRPPPSPSPAPKHPITPTPSL